ncbi:MAG: transporter [Ferruginibacter sp.]|nr:transporter [Ferruginibacter sp.]
MIFSKIYFYALIPVFTILAGGVAGMLKKPGPVFRSVVLHFAAGVVFSVVAVELLPDIISNHQPIEVALGFSLGTITMLAVKFFAEKMERPSVSGTIKAALPYGLLMALGIDLLIDGLLLGVGFAAGNTEGILLAVALGLETFSLGLAVVVACSDARLSRQLNIVILLCLGLVFFAGAVMGITMLRGLSQEWLELVLSFGLAALLFLVTEELLTEAHEVKETVWHTSAFFVGFLLFLILGMIV